MTPASCGLECSGRSALTFSAWKRCTHAPETLHNRQGVKRIVGCWSLTRKMLSMLVLIQSIPSGLLYFWETSRHAHWSLRLDALVSRSVGMRYISLHYRCDLASSATSKLSNREPCWVERSRWIVCVLLLPECEVDQTRGGYISLSLSRASLLRTEY